MKGMRRGFVAAVLAACLAGLPGAAEAAGAIEVTTATTVQVMEVNAKGEKVEVRKDTNAAKVVPGDIVTFTLTYTNRGTQPTTGVAITNPIPEHMAYVDKSAEGQGTTIDYSVNGGKSYGRAERLTITDTKGKVRPALGQDYTHIRWTLGAPLAPGGTGTVSFKAKVK